jgi:hypothetical protein
VVDLWLLLKYDYGTTIVELTFCALGLIDNVIYYLPYLPIGYYLASGAILQEAWRLNDML